MRSVVDPNDVMRRIPVQTATYHPVLLTYDLSVYQMPSLLYLDNYARSKQPSYNFVLVTIMCSQPLLTRAAS